MSRKSGKMDKRPTKTKQGITPEASARQKVFTQDGGRVPVTKPKPQVTLTQGSHQRRRGKKILLIFMIVASICVVAAWAVFTVKPSLFEEVKARLPFTGAAKNKRSSARYPSRPRFKVVPPQRTNPLPPSTPPMMAEQMPQPQTSPSGIPPAAPPSAYPVTRPQVSTPGGPQALTPGAPGIPPSVPPSPTYPGPRPQVAVPGAPGIAPTMPPSSAPPFPGEVQNPPPGTSSFSPSKKEESESDEYLEIATLYAQKGKYQKAEELFQKVTKENPSSAKAHNNLGVVRLKQEKYDMAEREFKEAIRLEPAFVLPYYNLACLYSKKGVNVEALIYLKKALKRDERVKQWVKNDKDFDRLRSDVVFQELVGGSSAKKEGAKKTEGKQKPEKVQSQEGVPQKEAPLKKEEVSKQEKPIPENAPKTSPSRKEEIPPQSGPLLPVPPKQEEMQKQGIPPGSAQNQQVPHDVQGTPQGGAQNQQGGAAQSAPGGAAQ